MAETSWKENFDPEHPRLDNIGRKVYVAAGGVKKIPEIRRIHVSCIFFQKTLPNPLSQAT